MNQHLAGHFYQMCTVHRRNSVDTVAKKKHFYLFIYYMVSIFMFRVNKSNKKTFPSSKTIFFVFQNITVLNILSTEMFNF